MSDTSNNSYRQRSVELLQQFQQLQTLRVLAYKKFESGFKQFREDLVEETYQRICAEVTQEFKRISEEIIAIETTLRQHPRTQNAADIIRAVQNGEREHLMLTTKLHMLQLKRDEELRRKKAGKENKKHDCTHHHHHGGKCDHGVHLHEEENEESEYDEDELRFQDELKQLVKQRADNYDHINEKLEEMRYEILDLAEI
eukprot:GEZU01036606.1.p1 GENE.GEZU01036606.1~~GEZU01036606.1.p1  ORF type:complete len:207 (-),score=51.69 GEZU01036606.1:123-719(-)